MAVGRQYKEGLDYFELDCQLDDKIKLVQAEFGLKGFAIVVKLFQRIYGGHGYYCEWDEDRLLLFMSENGVSSDNKKLVSDIVMACIKRELFSSEMFDRYQILTSPGIQRRYLNAVSRRECITLRREFLLVELGEKIKNVNIKDENVDRKAKTDSTVTTEINREKKRKEKKSREEKGDSADKPRTATKIIEDAGFSPELEECVKEWVKYKIEKRQPYKETGLKSLLTMVRNKAAEVGDASVIEAINLAMASNWQGFHFDNVGTRTKTDRIKNRVKEVDSWVL